MNPSLTVSVAPLLEDGVPRVRLIFNVGSERAFFDFNSAHANELANDILYMSDRSEKEKLDKKP